ncbi:hypothetical protein EI94DRAFT_1707315 [Lactarius quietus]|nr:hypothetical protein EI94DRAFT_1707315 [Lactarius quietus]
MAVGRQASSGRQTNNPIMMDIYDTVKQKAPSQADIQTQLIMEEEGDHSIRGQTSWILCGLKIQELQYIDSLISASEWWFPSRTGGATSDRKQANGFLLHHGPMDNMSIPPLADYAEYDHIDDIDNSGVTAMIPHTSIHLVVMGLIPRISPSSSHLQLDGNGVLAMVSNLLH